MSFFKLGFIKLVASSFLLYSLNPFLSFPLIFLILSLYRYLIAWVMGYSALTIQDNLCFLDSDLAALNGCCNL